MIITKVRLCHVYDNYFYYEMSLLVLVRRG